MICENFQGMTSTTLDMQPCPPGAEGGGTVAKPKKDKLDKKHTQLILKQYYVSGTPDWKFVGHSFV